jgi:hypothetical protein
MDPTIKVLIGDIFASQMQTLVNTVNCVGIMGKGIALLFKKRHPLMYEDYERRCARGGGQAGRAIPFFGREKVYYKLPDQRSLASGDETWRRGSRVGSLR